MIMEFNRNEFVSAFTFALDFLEAGIRKNVTNHNKRVSLIALNIGEALGLDTEDMFDLYAYAMLHDNGITHQVYNALAENGQDQLERSVSHCIIGERNLAAFPFLRKREHIITYHHEAYNGSGYYGVSGDDIPLLSQIIALADTTEVLFRRYADKAEVIEDIRKQKGSTFSPLLSETFLEIAHNIAFWLSLDDMFVSGEVSKRAPVFAMTTELADLLPIAGIISGIIDAKSPFTGTHSRGLAQKAEIMADYYHFDEERKIKLLIAAHVHDTGKLIIPNSIIDKPGKLNPAEFEIMKTHTYYTRKVLEAVKGFEDITEWASNHHEKLNGCGYPLGFDKTKLDFESQLMTCLDIYQALTENRPYRTPLTHKEATDILQNLADKGEINGDIVRDITLHCAISS